jgi:hypothetical protein
MKRLFSFIDLPDVLTEKRRHIVINRRAFLKLSGVISAALSLLPFSFGKKLFAKPKEPISRVITYFAEEYGDGIFVLHSENPNEAKPPEITYWEYIRDYLGYWEEPEEMTKEDFDDFDISKKQLNDICPVKWYADTWWEWYSSTAGPHHQLSDYSDEKTLGEELYDKIDWIEGPHPGSNYTAVEFRDKETVLEFQKKINEFGSTVNIEFVNWDSYILYDKETQNA